jgi:hypothetical protein
MRGTRVDKLDNGRYRVLHFGRFFDGMQSKEFDMSMKDAYNLFKQLEVVFKKEDENVEAMANRRDSDNDNSGDDSDRSSASDNVK